jgi:hypothetical protein
LSIFLSFLFFCTALNICFSILVNLRTCLHITYIYHQNGFHTPDISNSEWAHP